jgi:hypothetical protein
MAEGGNGALTARFQALCGNASHRCLPVLPDTFSMFLSASTTRTQCLGMSHFRMPWSNETLGRRVTRTPRTVSRAVFHNLGNQQGCCVYVAHTIGNRIAVGRLGGGSVRLRRNLDRFWRPLTPRGRTDQPHAPKQLDNMKSAAILVWAQPRNSTHAPYGTLAEGDRSIHARNAKSRGILQFSSAT